MKHFTAAVTTTLGMIVPIKQLKSREFVDCLPFFTAYALGELGEQNLELGVVLCDQNSPVRQRNGSTELCCFQRLGQMLCIYPFLGGLVHRVGIQIMP